MAIIASVCANTRAIIIPVKILEALEGLRPRAWMLAKLLRANTAEGPSIHRLNIITNAKFRLIVYVLLKCFLDNYRYVILKDLDDPPLDGKVLFVYKQCPGNQTA